MVLSPGGVQLWPPNIPRVQGSTPRRTVDSQFGVALQELFLSDHTDEQKLECVEGGDRYHFAVPSFSLTNYLCSL